MLSLDKNTQYECAENRLLCSVKYYDTQRTKYYKIKLNNLDHDRMIRCSPSSNLTSFCLIVFLVLRRRVIGTYYANF